MSGTVVTDLFAEDQAHEEVVGGLIRRVARDRGLVIDLRIRRSRGGHGRAISELVLYQRSVRSGLAHLTVPDLLVVAIDANCRRFAAARKEIEQALDDELRGLAAIACPDPHVEKWCVADPESFGSIVGVLPRSPRRKCARDVYKKVLAEAVSKAGHVPTLGGIEFAAELADGMDLYRAGRADRSLKAFLGELSARLKRL
jgi:hypothetical protein